MSGEQYTQMDAGDGNARERGGSRRQLAMLTVVSGAFLVLAVVLLAVVIVGRGDSSSVEVGSKATPKTARSSLEGSTTTAVPDDQGARGALADVDLSGIDIAVGSKDFDEQLILGHLLAEAFEASGANVERQINLGGTNVTRSALLSGEIDSYAEYNGTGWTEHLKQEDPPSDGEELTEKVREMDGRENDIAWVGRAPFNNAYGFAAGRGLTDRNGGAFDFDSMADHLRQNPDASLCMESEFPNRSDGLVLFEEFTGYSVPDSQRQILDTGIIYTETGAGNCDFGEVFTTDGRIPELDLTVVEDDGAMIIYNISVNLRQEVYGQAPQAFEALAEAVLAPLDRETMSALNQRVSSGGEEPEDVAREYLIDQGLLAG